MMMLDSLALSGSSGNVHFNPLSKETHYVDHNTTATKKPIQIIGIDGSIHTLTDIDGFRRPSGSAVHCLNVKPTSGGMVTMFDDKDRNGMITDIKNFARLIEAGKNGEFDDIIAASGINI
jgi:hypothetical protein